MYKPDLDSMFRSLSDRISDDELNELVTLLVTLRGKVDSLSSEVERLLRRRKHYECHPNPDPSWEESLDVALDKAARYRALLEKSLKYVEFNAWLERKDEAFGYHDEKDEEEKYPSVHLEKEIKGVLDGE